MHLGAGKCNVCSLEDYVCYACRLVQEQQLNKPAQNPIIWKARGSCHTRKDSVRTQVEHIEEQALDLPLCETKGSYLISENAVRNQIAHPNKTDQNLPGLRKKQR